LPNLLQPAMIPLPTRHCHKLFQEVA
jgi:hypothetical protein